MPILHLSIPNYQQRFDRTLIVTGDNTLTQSQLQALTTHPDYPTIREYVSIDGIPQATVGATDAVLAFVNQAKAYQLEAVPGIGRTTARAIIAARPEGGFTDLGQVSELLPDGITLESLKDWAR